MDRTRLPYARPGIALPVVLFAMLAVGAIATAAALLNANAVLIHTFDERQSVLEAAADAGLEEARARLNGNPDLYPDTGFVVLERDAPVLDARGRPIPNVRRSVYVGPTGVTTGQYGVFGSIVVEAVDAGGARVVRRAEITDQSFARFAYFTDEEPSNIAFGGGDQIFGPVHTNDVLKIYDSGATFHGPVTTAETISGVGYGDFRQGYEEGVARIPMPETEDLEKLRDLAEAGDLDFSGSMAGSSSQATLRIEFDTIGDHGFIKVYQSNDPAWVTADVPYDYWRGLENSENCGHYEKDGTFRSAADHGRGDPHSWEAALRNGGRCYLGGSDSLFGEFVPDDGNGRWLRWPGQPADIAVDAGRADAAYLFPISRAYNPDFKGVIFVEGKVAVSGVVRGHVTLAATGDIIIVDDLEYATDPGAADRNCADGDVTNDDILGLFSGDDVIVANNTINAPTDPDDDNAWDNDFVSFDDTPEEVIHATILALSEFTVDDYDSGAWSTERCEGKMWGRGCLYLTGGVIQKRRGAVGAIRDPGGYGYLKRYSYDQCVRTSPPPFFPTTGHFTRGHVFEVDPNGFDVAEYFRLLTAGS